jgi:diguanylate cyclase (GGDEF)-like protein/PAS domain S-box-containing protein
MKDVRKTKLFMAGVILTGIVCVVTALVSAPWNQFDLLFLLLVCFTIGLGSQITVQIPRVKSHIAVSDTFIFFTLLAYGGDFAIALAAFEAFASSWRFCKKKTTVLFNAATMAVSTTAVVSVLKLLSLTDAIEAHGHNEQGERFVIALSAIALTQFIANTSLASVYDSLSSAVPLWETWKNKYIWTFFTYFVGAGGAALLIGLSDVIGFVTILATFPVIFFVYLSYRMYLKNVEISIKQAEQAGEYASILETQSIALRESEERFRSAFDYAPIGIGLVSPSGSWLKVNQALINILGYTEEELLTMDFQAITLPDDLGVTLIKIHELITGKIANWQMEQRYLHKAGKIVWTSWSVSTATDTKSQQPNLIFQIQDITGKKLAEEKLQHDATHDVLTGLPNRSFFMQRLSKALGMTKQITGYRVSVLFIDLDRFKYVNDSLGHLVGDQLLKGIAGRLKDCMRPADIVARLGGDEFTILVEGIYDTQEVTRIAERIQHKFSVPFTLRGHDVYSSASIGILHASDKHESSEDMMRDADTAMYQAKRAGKARHEVFDEEMHSIAKETLKLETDLRRAVERDEISVHYQPIFSLKTGTIESLESLARWQHAELGMVSPSKFIPLAEEIGLIDKVCEQVLRRACCDINSLENLENGDGTRRGLPFSINLSCRQFGRNTLVENINDILNETGFARERLRLEITESVFFEHQERAIAMLDRLRESGIEINIDDFGTGYSNLGYLMKLPVSALKIDRTFISMIDDEGGNDAIVRTIVTLARNLGLRVIAEGVETESQLSVLKDLGCESGQGFLFAEPMPFDLLCEFIASRPHNGFSPAAFDQVPSLSLVQ